MCTVSLEYTDEGRRLSLFNFLHRFSTEHRKNGFCVLCIWVSFICSVYYINLAEWNRTSLHRLMTSSESNNWSWFSHSVRSFLLYSESDCTFHQTWSLLRISLKQSATTRSSQLLLISLRSIFALESTTYSQYFIC